MRNFMQFLWSEDVWSVGCSRSIGYSHPPGSGTTILMTYVSYWLKEKNCQSCMARFFSDRAPQSRKSSHPTHPVDLRLTGWIAHVWFVSKILCCSVCVFFVVSIGSAKRSNTFDRDDHKPMIIRWVRIFDRGLHPCSPTFSGGTKRACWCVAAKFTLLPNNCDMNIFDIWYNISAHDIHWFNFREILPWLHPTWYLWWSLSQVNESGQFTSSRQKLP